MTSIEYVIVTNRLATLKELRYDYDIWEILDLYEACMVQIYNKAAMINEGGKNNGG